MDNIDFLRMLEEIIINEK